MREQTVAVTMGDAGGIGPEVVVKAVKNKEVSKICIPVVIGDREVLEDAAELAGTDLKDIKIVEPHKISFFTKGLPTKQSGYASFCYIKKAVEGCLSGKFDAMVTAPISKESLHLAGLKWPGHTEMLAELTGTKRYAMMLVGGPLKVVLATTHLALRDVPSFLSEDKIYEKIVLSREALELLGKTEGLIGVAGLNPHSGEGGLFGDEEERIIRPAVNRASREGINVIGPLPPDVIFRLAYKGDVDIVVAMYHDQGLIPLKMIAFDEGVNITLGLPIVRTSPDHGTAYDIAWTGKANPRSTIEAIKLAVQLSMNMKIS